MDEHSARWLNELNRHFYATVADEFDTTRGRPWPGWTRLLPYLKGAQSVLDVGSGNGRFGAFMAERVPSVDTYHGLDNNADLLEKARMKLTEYPRLVVRFDRYDFMDDALPDSQYDAVALFGVLHHVPGVARRVALVRSLAERVVPGGMLMFACWRFAEYARFRDRFVSLPADIPAETGDTLLDWRRGANALRYCHYVDDAELNALVAATGLRELARFRADGEAGDMNVYVVLSASSSSFAVGA